MYRLSLLNLILISSVVFVGANTTKLSNYNNHEEINDKPTDCRMQLDLLILADESSSIKKHQWEQLIPFIKEIISSLDIGYKRVRLSFITFGSAIRNLISFTDYGSKSKTLALKQIEKLWKNKAKSSLTYTGLALTFAREVTFKIGSRNKVPKAIILITDGASSDPELTSQVAAQLRSDGITILVVGVENASKRECRHIAGCHESQGPCPTFIDTNWTQLQSILGGLMKQVCNSKPKDAICRETWSIWSKCSAKCGKGVRSKQLLELTTIKPETLGDNGIRGRSCNDQFWDYSPVNEICEAGICSIDAKASEWSEWSNCSLDCGNGFRKRYKSLIQKQEGHGKSIEELGVKMIEKKECILKECPKDAGCGIFGQWSKCKQPCGPEVKTRKRTFIDQPMASNGGKTCAEQGLSEFEQQDCGNLPCKNDFIGEWSEWSECQSDNKMYRKRDGYNGNDEFVNISGRNVRVVQVKGCLDGDNVRGVDEKDADKASNDKASNDKASNEKDTDDKGFNDETSDEAINDKSSNENAINEEKEESSDESSNENAINEMQLTREKASDENINLIRVDEDDGDGSPSNAELNPFEFAYDEAEPDDEEKASNTAINEQKEKASEASDVRGFNEKEKASEEEKSKSLVRTEEGYGDRDPDNSAIESPYEFAYDESDPGDNERTDANNTAIKPPNGDLTDGKAKRKGHQTTQAILASYKNEQGFNEAIDARGFDVRGFDARGFDARGFDEKERAINVASNEAINEEKEESSDEDKNDSSYNEYKIAGGVLGAILLLGSSGYVYFKRRSMSPFSEREIVNYSEENTMEYGEEEERFTVTEMDDTLWGETA